MGSLFKTPKVPDMPPPPAAPPTPSVDAAKQMQLQQDRLASRRGRAAAILTGAQGDLASPPTTGAKTLLGS